tara:strand:- start:145 stop:666 length:522 start_codon:yes stop_codon:yes gene_type:complete
MREMEAVQAQSEGWKSKYEDAQSQLMQRMAELDAAREQVSSLDPGPDPRVAQATSELIQRMQELETAREELGSLGPDLQAAQATNARLTDELASAREQMERLVATHATEIGNLRHELKQREGLKQTTADLRARNQELEARMRTSFISPDARTGRAARTGGAAQLGRFSASHHK